MNQPDKMPFTAQFGEFGTEEYEFIFEHQPQDLEFPWDCVARTNGVIVAGGMGSSKQAAYNDCKGRLIRRLQDEQKGVST